MIEFSNVSKRYPQGHEALHDVSLRIETGEMAFLTGHSGAGKSTLASLLLMLHYPNKGDLFYDGTDCHDIPLSVLRSQISLVPQDIFLFGGSIRENICYGDPGATKQQVIEAAKQANAWEFINRFPEGLDTIVGERGTQLSGGQRQRVAIARAIDLETQPESFNPVIVDFYEKVGYLPDALVNYLLLLGWALDDRTERFTRQEMIDLFGVDGIVFHEAKTCPSNTNCRYAMPQRIQERLGIPSITIAGDLNDLRLYSEEQTRTKIQAFAEQLAETP